MNKTKIFSSLTMATLALSSVNLDAMPTIHDSILSARDFTADCILHAADKTLDCMATLMQLPLSTGNIIWEGTIGTQSIKVIHECGHKYNGVSYAKAVELWAKNCHLFKNLLPLLGGKKNIIINMCSNEYEWSVYDNTNTYEFTIGKDLETLTQEESEFILAHEMSHVILEHANRSQNFKGTLQEWEKEKRKYEKEADLLAAKLLGSANGGITLFSKTQYPRNPVTIIQHIISRMLLDIDNTHPRNDERVTYLKKWQKNHKSA